MNSSRALPVSIPGIASFRECSDGLIRLRITTALAEAELSLDGAHLTHFQPAGAAPVLFLSRASHFAPGRPIRGGVPICSPWFGPRAGQPEAPAHGFARIIRWDVDSLTADESGLVTAVLSLTSDEATRPLWPHEFTARLRVEIARHFTMRLDVENTGDTPFQFEEALHTYFTVSDVREISVTGLEGAGYLDKTDGLRSKQLGSEPLRIVSETDRVFPAADATCVIHDPGLKRRIIIEKSGSQTTVVWNPWIAKAAAMPDFGDDEWPRMLCIETANAAENAVTLASGATHRMTALVGRR